MRKTVKRVLIWGLTLALLAGVFGCPVGAAEDLTFNPTNAATLKKATFYEVTTDCRVTGSTTNHYLRITRSPLSLTLDNVSIQLTNRLALQDTETTLTLNLTGDNTLSSIQCSSTDLTVKETGKLTIVDCEEIGISVKSFIMESGTILPQTPSVDDSLPIRVNDSTPIITGGSLNASFNNVQPQNAAADGDPVYLTEIQLVGAGAGKKIAADNDVQAIRPDNQVLSYTFAGAQTDADGMFYFWLPKDTEITSIKAGGVTYTGNAVTIDPSTLVPPAESPVYRFQPQVVPAPLPYNVIKTSENGAYTNTYDGLTITEAGDYVVSSNGEASKPITVSAATGNVNLTMNGVRASIPHAEKTPALTVTGATTVKLLLSNNTENKLLGGNEPGLSAPEGEIIIDAAPGAAFASLDMQGGVGIKAKRAAIKGGVVSADIEAANIEVTGGSVFGTIKGSIATVPLEIKLVGAAYKTPVTAAAITAIRNAYAYNLGGVYTTGGTVQLLRVFLPVGAILSSVTADGREYTPEEDFEVESADESVKLYPPRFEAYTLTGGTKTDYPVTSNTYQRGLILEAGGTAHIEMLPGVDEADAPIRIDNESGCEVVMHNLNVDTENRRLTALTGVVRDKPVTLSFRGHNAFSSAVLIFPEAKTYNIAMLYEDGASVTFKNASVSPLEATPASKASGSPNLSFLRLLSDVRIQGGASGKSAFTFVRDAAGATETMNNIGFSFQGILPLRGKFIMDKNSSITVGENGMLLILPKTKILGEGRIHVKGQLIGDPGMNVYYAIDASAVGKHPLTVTGVTNGYAKSGDTVTASIVDTEDFLGWDIAPEIDGLDLTQNSVSFTADRAYTVRALYETPVKGVAFDKKACEVETGDSLQLKWAFSPDDATNSSVTFVTGDAAIAEVDAEGVVYGVAAGTAKITVTTVDGGFTDTCDVTVTDGAVRPLDVEKAAIKKGAVMKLKAPAGYEGTWSVKNTAIAAITKKNRLKGVELGETELIFTVGALTSKRPSLVQGKRLAVGESASVGLAVRRKKELVSSIGFGAKKLYLAPGEELTLAPVLKPKTALDTALAYRTSDARIVRVEAGKLTAMALGKATITGTAPSFVQKKLNIVVTNALQGLTALEKKGTVSVGNYYQCQVALNPLGLTDVPMTWVSKSPAIASVDDNGLVQGLKKGKAKIVASSGKKKATVTVTVTEN